MPSSPASSSSHRRHHDHHHRHDEKTHSKKDSKKSKKHDKKKTKKKKKHHHHHSKHQRKHSSSGSSGSSDSSESNSGSDSESKLVARAKKALKAAEKRHGAPIIDQKEDFLSRQPEFRVWLYNTKEQCVSDVDKKVAKKLFEKFARKWNAGELPDLFYKGIPQAVIDQVPRTKTRAWGFKKNLSEADKAALVKARDTVETFTLTDKITQSISHTPWSKTREQKKREAEAAAAKAREEANSRKRSRPSSSSLASSNAAALPTGGVAKAARMAALQAAEEAKIAALKAQFHLSGAKMQIAPRK
eukprot:INCI1513.1.p1 GENE.INCI1513.1~~INCI1513.1.p1  ORF type:complete len:301 (+),score=71.49 INCI1513.1:100-1002(+)